MKKLRLNHRQKRMLVGYTFLAPVIIGLAYMFIPAMAQSFWMSLHDVTSNPTGGFTMDFTGLANFNQVFNINITFKETLIDILVQMVINVFIILVFSFIIANILNQKFRLRGFARALFFIPVIISTGIIARIESTDLIAAMYGVVDSTAAESESVASIINIDSLVDFYFSLGLGGELGEMFLSFVILAIERLTSVLLSSGVQIIVFLSALQGVPPALYEAAHVEGCSGWEAFWKITLPALKNMIVINAVYVVVFLASSEINEVVILIRSKYLLDAVEA